MAKNPINRDSLKKLLDTVTHMNPESAERFVREVVRVGDERRRDAERVINEVAAAGRKSAEHFSAAVQQEVAKQIGRLVQRIDSLETQIEHVNKSLETTRAAMASVAGKTMSRTKSGSSTKQTPVSNVKTSAAKKDSAPTGKSKAKKKAPAKSASKTSQKASQKSSGKSGSKKKSSKSTAPQKKAQSIASSETSATS